MERVEGAGVGTVSLLTKSETVWGGASRVRRLKEHLHF